MEFDILMTVYNCLFIHLIDKNKLELSWEQPERCDMCRPYWVSSDTITGEATGSEKKSLKTSAYSNINF